MPTTPTTNYDWGKPEVDGDEGAWGDELNAVMDAIDSDLKDVSDVADAALPLAGGVMTGRQDQLTSTTKAVHAGSISGAHAFDLALSNYFTGTVTGTLTPSFTNVPSGTFLSPLVLRLTNAGAFAINWPASVQWSGGEEPALTADGVDILVFLSDDDGVTWRGMLAGADFS